MLIILCKRKTKFIKRTCCFPYFPPPAPLQSWLLLRVWHEHFSFSCAYMDAYISPPSKKIHLGYHTHLSIKAHCNQPLRVPIDCCFRIFTPCEPLPRSSMVGLSGCDWQEAARGDGLTRRWVCKRPRLPCWIFSFSCLSLRESQMPCFRDTQPVEGSTRWVSEAG